MDEKVSPEKDIKPQFKSVVYLLPSSLYDGVTETIPAYILNAIKQCRVFFVENERTARRFLKSIWKEMVIDDYEWHSIHKAEESVIAIFREAIHQKKIIGIISEAGCPGIADPGQLLVCAAQEMHAAVKPLVGPSSILLSLMASGFNGQQFRFNGYLAIDASQRKKQLQQLEEEVSKKNVTQIFIETPFRNEQLLKDILNVCRPGLKLCIAADITAPSETIQTKTIKDWKSSHPPLHKRPVIFLLGN